MLRCIRCGSPVEGMAQYCASCAASSGLATGPAVATVATCPRCGSPLSQEGAPCPFCSGTVEALGYAGFWMRFVAYIVDAIIIGAVGFAIGLAVATPLSSLISLVIGIAYYVGFWTAEGATPGKMLMGIRIVKANGEPLDAGAAFLRYIGYFVSTITLLIGFLMIAFTREKRGLHDYIAGTVVVHGVR